VWWLYIQSVCYDIEEAQYIYLNLLIGKLTNYIFLKIRNSTLFQGVGECYKEVVGENVTMFVYSRAGVM
jgi:hypothetical protein